MKYNIANAAASAIRATPEIYMPLIQLVENAEHPDARDGDGMASVAAMEVLCFGAGLAPEDHLDTTAEEWEVIYCCLTPDEYEE